MRFVTFEQDGKARAGVISGESVVALDAAGFPTMLSVLEAGAAALPRIAEYASKAGAEAFELGSVKLMAPIPRPTKIICIGLNYRDHAIETGMAIPSTPTVFTKFPSVVIGPGDKVVLPKNSTKPDYEAELAVVIGKRGRYVAAADWQDYVFGYMNANDVSARDYQLATTQWTIGKTFDTFAPMGPYLVTADEIANPHNLKIGLTINGDVMQKSNTKELIFGVPALVEYLSSVFTLEPGDVILTGTPPGVGMALKPPRWLLAGDSMTVSIEGLGELTNPVVAETDLQ